MLDLVGRSSSRELEMIVPAFGGIAKIGIDVGAMKHVAGAVGVEDGLVRDRDGRERVSGASFAIPKQAALTHRDTTDPATATLEVVQHPFRAELHLFAHPLSDDRDVNELQ